jgi:hypothetical protein
MARQERDDIMDWVANEESFYNQVMRLYDRWVDQGDAWGERQARREAFNVITGVAQALQARHIENGEYTLAEIDAAIDRVLEDFEQYREEELASRQSAAAAKPVPRKPMDAGAKEYAARMEAMILKYARCIYRGEDRHIPDAKVKKSVIQHLLGYMPASAARIRRSIETGDEHLNRIKLRDWDDQAEMLGYRSCGMSLSDAVGILKHVAKWYYA